MKYLFFLFILISCSKPQSILICGDRPCANKKEANKYFEDNLTLEIKIIDEKKEETFNLVNLNLNKDKIDNVQVFKKVKDNYKNDTIKKKKITKKKLDNKKAVEKTNENVLLNKTKKVDNKEKRKDKSFVKLNANQSQSIKKLKSNKIKIKKDKSNQVKNICLILEKCDIDQITKYLIEEVNNRDFPDITKSE